MGMGSGLGREGHGDEEKPGEHCYRMGGRQNLCWKIQVEFELDCTPRVRLCGKRAGPSAAVS